MPGALAAFVPEKPVPKFKYESNGGRSEITRAVGGPNKKLFFAGCVSFVRMAFSHNARFTFLGNVNASPIAIAWFTLERLMSYHPRLASLHAMVLVCRVACSWLPVLGVWGDSLVTLTYSKCYCSTTYKT